MAFFNVSFINESVVDEELGGEDGKEVVEKRRQPEDVFIQDLIVSHLDKYGQYFVQYCKFRNLVNLDPLMPDKEALKELEQLLREEATLVEKKQDTELQLEEDIANFAADKEQIPAEELEAAQKEFNVHKESFENEIVELGKDIDERQERIQELEQRKKVSVDEERTEPVDMKTYSNDFIQNPETSNKISSVLSAMITSIESNSPFKEGSVINQA